VDSRRSITEAECVSKLTELAFVFIPLSFVASLFSMQVHELDGGVPLYQFAPVAISVVVVAYIVRLASEARISLRIRTMSYPSFA
jgi:Mg2+ and Co2+ transporter CorA